MMGQVCTMQSRMRCLVNPVIMDVIRISLLRWQPASTCSSAALLPL